MLQLEQYWLTTWYGEAWSSIYSFAPTDASISPKLVLYSIKLVFKKKIFIVIFLSFRRWLTHGFTKLISVEPFYFNTSSNFDTLRTVLSLQASFYYAFNSGLVRLCFFLTLFLSLVVCNIQYLDCSRKQNADRMIAMLTLTIVQQS
jgi:hypothetical protein